MAGQLHLSAKTVETCWTHATEKLGLQSGAQPVEYALRRDLLGE
ncbi:hypothetical protein [Roseiflexus sp.]|nr:hypothetical protein [Roseiflexus sp.]MCL6540657.1 hypothetical protein [Roseiflexus sp.]